MNAREPVLPEQVGRYQVVRLLGQGAMGRVALAHDPVLDRDVAIKWLRTDLGLTPPQTHDLVRRMRQEARASARVSHPAIVALHDMGEDECVGLYLVFEYLDGVTLAQRLQRGPLESEHAAALAETVGAGLSMAHTTGILHRDIKPQNLILTDTGAKVTDFGIARVPNSTLTRGGGLLGTPAYSAPEAIQDGAFSPQSDQFSLAATLWETLTGQRAFPGEDTVAVSNRIATEHPPRLTDLCGLDRGVDAVFARALAKRPEARYPSCHDFGRALAEALRPPTRSTLQTLPDALQRQRAQRQLERRVIRAGWIGLGLGLLIAIVGFGIAEQFRSPRELPLVATPPQSALVPHRSSPSTTALERPRPTGRPSSSRLSPRRVDAIPVPLASAAPAPGPASADGESAGSGAGSNEVATPVRVR
jgi:serine/threonine protein kinase